jgi:hypothetical protein
MPNLISGSTGDGLQIKVFGPGGGDGGLGGGNIFKPGDTQRKARSFAFVIDASGSMVDTLPFVAAELNRTLRSLQPWHHFTIIYYQNNTATEAISPGLKPVNEENIRAALRWLEYDAPAPMGQSSPIKAIELALKHKPELMFLLSDDITGRGPFEQNQQELVARIKQANTGGTKINTIQFLHADPIMLIGNMKPTLQRISEDSQGIYKFYSASDLGL